MARWATRSAPGSNSQEPEAGLREKDLEWANQSTTQHGDLLHGEQGLGGGFPFGQRSMDSFR